MLLEFLKSRQRRTKVVAYFLIDLLLLPVCFYVAHTVRYGTIFPTELGKNSGILVGLIMVAGAAVILGLRLPWLKLSTLEGRAAVRIALASSILSATTLVLFQLAGRTEPSSLPLIFGVMYFVGSIGTRYMMLVVFTFADQRGSVRRPAVIYGAGPAGLQLAYALRRSSNMRPVAFVDDSKSLQGTIMAGLPVVSTRKLEQLKRRWGNPLVFLALQASDQARLHEIVAHLVTQGYDAQFAPKFGELIWQQEAYNIPVGAPLETIVNREEVLLDTPEIMRTYAGRTVLVTGAGASIGAELCVNLIECQPKKIVLFDHDETGLYETELALKERNVETKIEIVARLGSTTEKSRIEAVLRDERVDVIFHISAYGRPSLFAQNEVEGTRVNVIGTQVIAEAASSCGVERFVLVSSEKAFKPKCTLSAVRRMAELVVQDIAGRSPYTDTCIVRLRGALGPGGSVISLLQRQIEMGGPVTIPHHDAERCFMTLSEATRLLLIAGTLADDGEVFTLDMGKATKIIDVARKVIALSGRSVRDPITGKGDIEIRTVGLRPGEKLSDAALFDSDQVRSTKHPRILRIDEPKLSQFEVTAMMREVRTAIQLGSVDAIRRLTGDRIPDYEREEKVRSLERPGNSQSAV